MLTDVYLGVGVVTCAAKGKMSNSLLSLSLTSLSFYESDSERESEESVGEMSDFYIYLLGGKCTYFSLSWIFFDL